MKPHVVSIEHCSATDMLVTLAMDTERGLETQFKELYDYYGKKSRLDSIAAEITRLDAEFKKLYIELYGKNT